MPSQSQRSFFLESLVNRKAFLRAGLFIVLMGDIISLVTLGLGSEIPEKVPEIVMIGYLLIFFGQMLVFGALFLTRVITRYQELVLFIIGISFGLITLPFMAQFPGIITFLQLEGFLTRQSMLKLFEFLFMNSLSLATFILWALFQVKLIQIRFHYWMLYLRGHFDVKLTLFADLVSFAALLFIIFMIVFGAGNEMIVLSIFFILLLIYHVGYWAQLSIDVVPIFVDPLVIEQAIHSGAISHAAYFFGKQGPQLASYWFPQEDGLSSDKKVLDFFTELGVKLMTQSGYGADYGQGLIYLEIESPIRRNVLFISFWGTVKDNDLIDDRFENAPYSGFCVLVKPQFAFLIEGKLNQWKKFVRQVFAQHCVDDLPPKLVNSLLLEFITKMLIQ